MKTLIDIIDSLPDAYKPALITSSTAILGAFIGAIVAQYLSHKLTLKRERTKQLSEIYYKLYSPIIFEIYAFIDICTHFRRGHDINSDVDEAAIYDKIFNHVEANLMFASPRIKKAFFDVKKSKYSFDGSGFMSKISELLFLLNLLEDLHHLVIKTSIYDKENQNDLMANKIYLLTWALLLYICADEAEALETIKYKWLFDKSLLTEKNYKQMKQKYGFQIMTEDGYMKKKFSSTGFLNYLVDNLILKQEYKEMFKEIKEKNIEIFE
ncbi:hypothetical protein [Bacillus sp. FSL K6-6540]|uniref:hypothetical protein n=1 Tax=Bacillus sp. FSL K6-6540 TaxID=2921512 RepID=UPI0030F8F978